MINKGTIDNSPTKSGNNTFTGTNTFTKTISGSISGNAGSVTNGVYTTGDQTIDGTKTFSSTISGSISGNAGSVTNGVYTTGNQTIAGSKTFTDETTVLLSSSSGGRSKMQSSVFDLTDTSRTSSIGMGLRTLDKNGNVWGEFSTTGDTAGGTSAVMQVRNRASGTQTTAQIKINIDKNGNVATECPTPSSNDNSTKIATTAWVNNEKSTICGWCCPDYSTGTSISITSGTEKTFAATKNCFVVLRVVGTGTQSYIKTSNGSIIQQNDVASQAASIVTCSCFVKSGDSIKIYGSGSTVQASWFSLYGG